MCIKSGCGCSGIFTIEELLEAVEQFKREIEKEREGELDFFTRNRGI
jgi:hypothetical protein